MPSNEERETNMSEMLRRLGLGSHSIHAIALCLSLSISVGVVASALLLTPTVALADDDDDSDDDDDGDGGIGGGGGFGGSTGGGGGTGVTRSDGGGFFNLFRRREVQRPRRARQAAPRRSQSRRARQRRTVRSRPRQQQRPAVTLPTEAQAEIIALGLTSEELDQLLADGYGVVEQQEITAIGATLLRLSVPAGTSLEDARTAVRAVNADAVADFNHYYRPVESQPQEPCEGLSCGAALQIGWPVQPGSRSSCTSGATIGIIDTGINAQHNALTNADLTVLPFDAGSPDARRSSATHGTAVAAILLSGDQSRAPGLVPDAKVYAVDAFVRGLAGGRVSDERADAYTLVRALDLIAQRPLTVLNLSLAGPPNATVQSMIERIADEGVVMVASAGNSGPRGGPLYPAAYPQVIGVTAVDHTNRVFRRATQGDHVDFAAPGVEVWTAASVRGVKPRTGTSFATPFVTAAVALLQSRDDALGLDEIRSALASGALDLGDEGRDPVYGFGLVQADWPCADPVPDIPVEAAVIDASVTPEEAVAIDRPSQE